MSAFTTFGMIAALWLALGAVAALAIGYAVRETRRREDESAAVDRWRRQQAAMRRIGGRS